MAADRQSRHRAVLLDLAVLRDARVVAEDDRALVDLLVVGAEHASLGGGQRLAGHQRHRGDLGDRAGQPALVERSVRVGDVLDDRHASLLGDGHQRVHVGRVAREVNGDDRLRARGDLAAHVLGVDAEGVRLDVGEDDGAAEAQDGDRGGPVGDGRADDLIALAHAEAVEGAVEGRGAGVVREGVLRPLPLRVLRLQRQGGLERGHLAAVEHVQQGLLVAVVDDRVDEDLSRVFRHSLRTAVDGECGHGGQLLVYSTSPPRPPSPFRMRGERRAGGGARTTVQPAAVAVRCRCFRCFRCFRRC